MYIMNGKILTYYFQTHAFKKKKKCPKSKVAIGENTFLNKLFGRFSIILIFAVMYTTYMCTV